MGPTQVCLSPEHSWDIWDPIWLCLGLRALNSRNWSWQDSGNHMQCLGFKDKFLVSALKEYEPQMGACKASLLPAVLSLWPCSSLFLLQEPECFCIPLENLIKQTHEWMHLATLNCIWSANADDSAITVRIMSYIQQIWGTAVIVQGFRHQPCMQCIWVQSLSTTRNDAWEYS